MIKKKINLVIADDTEPVEYLNFLNKIFDINIVKTKDIGKTVSKSSIDLALFTGGEDVNPANYSQKTGKYTHFNNNRDEQEINLFQVLPKKTPKLGICRGAQLLTVLSGAELIQDVNNHGITHQIDINNYGTYKMTSTHHQMMYPFKLNPESYNIIAHSTYFQSTSYLNGDNVQIMLPNDFVEPEIVFYNETNSLCIQGHPEAYNCEENTVDVCLRLIKNQLFKTTTKPVNIEYSPIDNDFDYNEQINDSQEVVENELKYLDNPNILKTNIIFEKGKPEAKWVYQQIADIKNK